MRQIKLFHGSSYSSSLQRMEDQVNEFLYHKGDFVTDIKHQLSAAAQGSQYHSILVEYEVA